MTAAVADSPQVPTPAVATRDITIAVRPAPVREPPFDDELVDSPAMVGRYDRPLPFARHRRRRPPLPQQPPTPLRAALPDPAHWARRLLVGIIETADGRRSLNQVAALLSPGVAHGLRTEFEQAGQLGRPHWTHRAVVRSVRASEPADQVAELCATVRTGERVRAIAMRLEVRHARWCCTRLVLG